MKKTAYGTRYVNKINYKITGDTRTPPADGIFVVDGVIVNPNSCGTASVINKCKANWTWDVTTFASKSETQRIVKTGYAKKILVWNKLAGYNPSRTTYRGGTRMLNYLGADRNSYQIGRGLCYYSIARYTAKGVIDQPSGIAESGISYSTPQKVNVDVSSGWYSKEYNSACK